jgi:FMN phosphatase YigB (HAD superfamily)
MSRAQPSGQFVLRLFDTFVFVDWFGTLSTARFWDRILLNNRHPLSAQLRDALDGLFRGRKEFVRGWMRGEVPEAEVIDSLQMRLPKCYRDDYLCRELLRDCREAPIDPDMSELINSLKSQAFIGVASDNMDCFIRATPKVLSGELAIDELIVSSEVGHLKAERPDKFFGPTLERYGLEPRNSVLIDDCPNTCDRFREWGGHAFHFTDVVELRKEIRNGWPTELAVAIIPPDASSSSDAFNFAGEWGD